MIIYYSNSQQQQHELLDQSQIANVAPIAKTNVRQMFVVAH